MEKKNFLISHGKMAEGMANSLEMLLGNTDGVTTFGLMPGESPDHIAEAIERAVLAHPEDRVFILADMLGGSVSNSATRLAAYPNVRMINGVNLSTAVSVFFAEPDITDEELKALLEEARNTLDLVSPILPASAEEDDDIL